MLKSHYVFIELFTTGQKFVMKNRILEQFTFHVQREKDVKNKPNYHGL